jgi:hypothetical protein
MKRQQTLAPGNHQSQALARGLGWFSILLGVTELVAPSALARWLGMPGSASLLRAYGAREIGTGLAILAANDPTPFLWGRVGGDALDAATLAAGLNENNPKKGNVGVAFASVLGVALLDAACATALSIRHRQMRVRRRTATQTYARRRGFRAAPEAMRGAARDFKIPEDMRTPKLLRPFSTS